MPLCLSRAITVNVNVVCVYVSARVCVCVKQTTLANLDRTHPTTPLCVAIFRNKQNKRVDNK